MKVLALLLVALGIVGLVYGGIGYNHQKTILEVGGLKATATEHKTIPIAPVVGVIALIGGIALLAADRRPGLARPEAAQGRNRAGLLPHARPHPAPARLR